MTRKGCIVTVVVLLVLIGGVVLGIHFLLQSVYNPHHHGKRLYTWTEQAIHSPDPAARREATEALVGAFKDMRRGEPRIQLVMRFCGTAKLPKEVLPFLVEALHAPEIQDIGRRSYQAIALSRVEDNAAIPTLVEVILHDEDQHARDGALAALCMMDSHGKDALPALREAARDENKDVQRRAEEAVKEIEREIKRAAELDARYPTPSRRQ
jgi:HEAT repeat protein